MRKKNKQISFFLLFSLAFAQQESFRSVEDIKDQWSGYTSYQKEEMVSFSEFLFNKGFYERCLLSLFELSYKFSNDPIFPNIQYHIARCYEEMGNYALSRRYYLKVIKIEPETSYVRKAAKYREIYISLIEGNDLRVLEVTKETKDPYLISFKGYAHLQRQEWEEARTTFILAQSAFNHPHYNELLTPLFKIIEDVGSLPMHNKYLVFFSGSIFPGGGQFILEDKSAGQGILISVGMMLVVNSWSKINSLIGGKRFLESEGNSIPLFKNYKDEKTNKILENKNKIPISMSFKSSSLKYVIPPLVVGTSIFISSSVLSFSNTEKKNQDLIKFFLAEELQKLSPKRFLDFAEPSLKALNK